MSDHQIKLTITVTADDFKLLESSAKANKQTVTELLHDLAMTEVEDEYDRQAFEQAQAEFKKDPQVYSIEEVASELGLFDGAGSASTPASSSSSHVPSRADNDER